MVTNIHEQEALYSSLAAAKNSPLHHSNDSGSGRPARNALKSPSDRSGCEKGASCDAPRTVAKDSAPPPNTRVHPPTCFPWNHARYGAVVFSRSLLASRLTSVLLPVSGITESWSPLQMQCRQETREYSSVSGSTSALPEMETLAFCMQLSTSSNLFLQMVTCKPARGCRTSRALRRC